MPEQHRYKSTKLQVDSVDMVRNSNKVLVKIEERNVEKKSDSGIILVAATDTDWNPAVHSDRYGVVHSVPSNLRYDKSMYSIQWDTDIEIKVGDDIWFDYMNSENCVVLECDDGNDYKLLEYENLYLVKRGDEIIPLNGYCLFSDVLIRAKSKFDPTDGQVDPRYGVVEHLAKPNRAYLNKTFHDDIELSVGDTVLFGGRATRYYVEEERYMALGKMLRPVQRKNVAAIVKDGEIISLAPNTVMVKPKRDTLTKAGIIVPMYRSDQQHFKAEVVMSNHSEIEAGQWVLCPKVAPLRHKQDDEEYYILTEEEVYFSWEE